MSGQQGPSRPAEGEAPSGPRANIEIKARIRDLKATARKAIEIGALFVGQDRQADTYFRVPSGRLKLRQSPRKGAELIIYFRDDTAGPRRSDYELLPVADPGRIRDLLGAMFGVQSEVRKIRRLYFVGTTRIHIDTVEGLGDFLEFEAVHPAGDADAEEAARAGVNHLMAAFGITPEDLVPVSYGELLSSAVRPEPGGRSARARS